MILLKLVNAITGLAEFGFVTSHPKDASLKLFQAMADLEKLKNIYTCLFSPLQIEY